MPANSATAVDDAYIAVIEKRVADAHLGLDITVNRGLTHDIGADHNPGALLDAIEARVKAANLGFDVTVHRPGDPTTDATGAIRVDQPLTPGLVSHGITHEVSGEAEPPAAQVTTARVDAPLPAGEVSHVDVNPRPTTLSDLANARPPKAKPASDKPATS